MPPRDHFKLMCVIQLNTKTHIDDWNSIDKLPYVPFPMGKLTPILQPILVYWQDSACTLSVGENVYWQSSTYLLSLGENVYWQGSACQPVHFLWEKMFTGNVLILMPLQRVNNGSKFYCGVWGIKKNIYFWHFAAVFWKKCNFLEKNGINLQRSTFCKNRHTAQ